MVTENYNFNSLELSSFFTLKAQNFFRRFFLGVPDLILENLVRSIIESNSSNEEKISPIDLYNSWQLGNRSLFVEMWVRNLINDIKESEKLIILNLGCGMDSVLSGMPKANWRGINVDQSSIISLRKSIKMDPNWIFNIEGDLGDSNWFSGFLNEIQQGNNEFTQDPFFKIGSERMSTSESGDGATSGLMRATMSGTASAAMTKNDFKVLVLTTGTLPYLRPNEIGCLLGNLVNTFGSISLIWDSPTRLGKLFTNFSIWAFKGNDSFFKSSTEDIFRMIKSKSQNPILKDQACLATGHYAVSQMGIENLKMVGRQFQFGLLKNIAKKIGLGRIYYVQLKIQMLVGK